MMTSIQSACCVLAGRRKLTVQVQPDQAGHAPDHVLCLGHARAPPALSPGLGLHAHALQVLRRDRGRAQPAVSHLTHHRHHLVPQAALTRTTCTGI